MFESSNTQKCNSGRFIEVFDDGQQLIRPCNLIITLSRERENVLCQYLFAKDTYSWAAELGGVKDGLRDPGKVGDGGGIIFVTEKTSKA